VPDAAFLKYVLQPGVLQDKPGPSMAMEFGPLLPDVGGSGVGFSWSGIVSQRWEWGTVHLNVETNLTQDQHGELFFDAIVEGPNKWKVRPVFEIYSDSVINQSQTFSALAGAIWQVNDKLSVDVAVRYALVDGRSVQELRSRIDVRIPVDRWQTDEPRIIRHRRDGSSLTSRSIVSFAKISRAATLVRARIAITSTSAAYEAFAWQARIVTRGSGTRC
jgi:hypothetical protein